MPKTKLTPEEYKKIQGSIESHQYRWDPEKKLWHKTIRGIRGIAAARRKAPRFILATKVGKLEGALFLTYDEKKKSCSLTDDKKAAKVFYHGYDDPATRSKYWGEIVGLKLYSHNF